MIETLSPRGRLLLEAARRNFELIREHGAKVSPAEAAFIIEQLAASIRSSQPLALAAMPEAPK